MLNCSFLNRFPVTDKYYSLSSTFQTSKQVLSVAVSLFIILDFIYLILFLALDDYLEFA